MDLHEICGLGLNLKLNDTSGLTPKFMFIGPGILNIHCPAIGPFTRHYILIIPSYYPIVYNIRFIPHYPHLGVSSCDPQVGGGRLRLSTAPRPAEQPLRARGPRRDDPPGPRPCAGRGDSGAPRPLV